MGDAAAEVTAAAGWCPPTHPEPDQTPAELVACRCWPGQRGIHCERPREEPAVETDVVGERPPEYVAVEAPAPLEGCATTQHEHHDHRVGTLMTPTEAVAGRVRQLRRSRGWTAAQLADKMAAAGIPWERTVVSRLETGQRDNVTLREVLALAYVLDVAPIHLFIPTDPEESEYQVVPSREIAVHAAREWVRGQAPLPGGDVRHYFSEVPVEEYAASAEAYLERLHAVSVHRDGHNAG